ncbi:MAG TPA: hypothetical protein VKL40_01320 [Candidatus Angelobacter sp.]|nr:hypothetical protein [Candidatus Angelobacter sp.]
MNSLRSKKRQAELAMSALGYVVGALFALGTSVSVCGATIFILRSGKLQLLEILLWIVFLFWQLVAILFEGFSPGLNFREVARYPVSLRMYVMLNAVYGLFDPAALAALLWLLSIWIGIVVVQPQWALPAAGLFLVFAALNVFCNRIIIGILERFQSTRKGRERVAVALLILMLVPQMFNLMINGLIKFPGHLPRWVHDVAGGVRHIAPPGLVLESLAPGTSTVLAPLALLAGYLALAVFLQVRQLRAVYLGEIYAESFQARRELKVKAGWRLPGMSGSMSAIVEKEVRYIRQNARLIVLLINPLVLVAFLAFAGSSKQIGFGISGGIGLLGAFALLLALSVSNLSYNTFGMDREGFGRWLLSPLPLQNVMRGKNLAQGALMSAVYLVGAPIILYVRHVPLNILVAMTAGFLSMLIIHLGAGNLFSVYWPRRIEFSQMSSRMTSGAAGFASLLVLLPTAAAIGGVILATWYWKLSWLPLPAALVGLGLSLVVYSWLTNWAVRHAQAHLEEIAGQLGV